jgi:hypothetical protein
MTSDSEVRRVMKAALAWVILPNSIEPAKNDGASVR